MEKTNKPENYYTRKPNNDTFSQPIKSTHQATSASVGKPANEQLGLMN
jgi:hypothetical protein